MVSLRSIGIMIPSAAVLFGGCLVRSSLGWLPASSSTIVVGNKNRQHALANRSRSPIILQRPSTSFSSSLTQVGAVPLPEGYQDYGETVIRNAGALVGAVSQDDLSIEWKADRIVVTVRGQVYVSATEEEEGDADVLLADDEDDNDDIDMDSEYLLSETESMDNDEDDDNDKDAMIDDVIDDEDDEDGGGASTSESPSSPRGIDVAALARAINAALDDGGIGLMIAETHEIEVTTPGASDELQGKVMFEAYRGFDVICQQKDLKTNKIKQIEGRLVERNDEFTILNIKGRMKKMENDTILSVKLPKAKKEKGGK
jgi:ribosome maturation factor RimP